MNADKAENTISTHRLWRDMVVVFAHGTACTFFGAIILSYKALLWAGVGYVMTVSMLLLAIHAPDASGLGFLADVTFGRLAPLVISLTVLAAVIWMCVTGRLWVDSPLFLPEKRVDEAHGRLRQRIHDHLKQTGRVNG